MLAVSPFLRKHKCDEGAGISEPFDSITYRYPVLLAYEESDADLAYAMAKALQDYLPYYKDAVSGLDGWDIWRDYAADAPAKDAEFQSGWMTARSNALDGADLIPLWRAW